ncbi:receptor-type tyrosine-protein phosphatase T-like isoform X2 [Anneissia japonica]|nr:receptor-type tyrosine-protein phosphatase T-like isoform X2 [Anneissia japonica]
MSSPCSSGYNCTSFTNPERYNCTCPTGYSGEACSIHDGVNQPTESPQSDTQLIIIIVVCMAVFLLLIIVVIVIVLRKRRKSRNDDPKKVVDVIELPAVGINKPVVPKKPYSNREKDHGNINRPDERVEEEEVELEIVEKDELPMQAFESPPIPVSSLSEYVRTRKETGQLRIEWKSFPEGLRFPATVALQKCNLKKNRYKNVVPYDHSRIVLQSSLNGSKPGSDYINACYIQGYNNPQRFIAAQGPNQTTVEDFWKLVWQENVHMIIMLTNLVEIGKRKCVQYWPDSFSALYGEIAVTFTNAVELSSYDIKTFKVYKANSPKRTLHLLHYKTWPDKNVPQNTQDVSKFIREMNTLQTYHHLEGPILVHCSAGAGRTGAFIAICAMLDMANEEHCVDIYNFVKEMRSRRPNMVQTSEQYIFIYETVLDESLCGNTLIPAMKFRAQFERLQAQNPETGKSDINNQFELLDSLSPVFTTNQKRISMSEENMSKNRYKDKVPVTSNRPMLAGGDRMSDYINASFFDSALKRDAFIATQAPLEHTVDDFWRLVYDYECCNIVSLTDPKTEGFVQYWSEQTLALPNTIVNYISKEAYTNNVTMWNMKVGKLSDTSNVGSTQAVKIFQFHAWPRGSDVPTSCRALLDLISAVLKAQESCENKPILVQCMDGVGRCGTFCATLACLQSLKQVQTVDVFQAVRVLRRNRTGMVETQGQYEFIYATILEQLNAFDIYENVKHTYQENEDEGGYANYAYSN